MMYVLSLEAVGTAYSDSSMSLQSMAWVDAPTLVPGTQLFAWAGRVSWKLNVDLLSKVGQAFCGELRSDFLHLESLMPLQSHSRTESVMPAWAPKPVRKAVMQLPFRTSLVWHFLIPKGQEGLTPDRFGAVRSGSSPPMFDMVSPGTVARCFWPLWCSVLQSMDRTDAGSWWP